MDDCRNYTYGQVLLDLANEGDVTAISIVQELSIDLISKNLKTNTSTSFAGFLSDLVKYSSDGQDGLKRLASHLVADDLVDKFSSQLDEPSDKSKDFLELVRTVVQMATKAS